MRRFLIPCASVVMACFAYPKTWAASSATTSIYKDSIVNIDTSPPLAPLLDGYVKYDFGGGGSPPACVFQISVNNHRGEDLALDLGGMPAHAGLVKGFGSFKIFLASDQPIPDEIKDFFIIMDVDNTHYHLSKNARKDRGGWETKDVEVVQKILIGMTRGDWEYRYFSKAHHQTVHIRVAAPPPDKQKLLLECVKEPEPSHE